ncbi:unnamed protein product [Chironomus riparius]|uniref:Ionotropic receptor n=1 Tax=Chironomus riparius TaxID=315576 RepID=A0A9N9RRP3_9DIPT|nr:unnamed protein product [Chironomus riparius]
MDLKFAFLWIFTVTILRSPCVSNAQISGMSNGSLISKVLHEITDKFLLREKTYFSITKLANQSNLIQDVLTSFLSGFKEKFSYFLYAEQKLVGIFEGSTFIFTDYLEYLPLVDKTFTPRRHLSQPIKYFVFARDLTFHRLKFSIVDAFNIRIPRIKATFYQYTYFITDEIDSIVLSTVEWFGPHGCDHPHVYIINVFNKTTMQWNKRLRNREKFLDYHGCELVFMVPTDQVDRTVTHLSGFAFANFKTWEIHGIAPLFFEIAAKYYNYTVGYQPVEMKTGWINRSDKEFLPMFVLNGTTKFPHVFFEILPIDAIGYVTATSKVVANLNVHLFLTPAPKYTPYEKFFLPFDLLTWIFLLITFSSTFLSIFVINNLSKSAQIIIYGHKIETPIWNVISIFFGISQTRLPNKNFSRFILLIFVYFCLIFRTCFQSKFFEFMTSEPRHPPPKTIEDVIDRGYNIYAMDVTSFTEENLGTSTVWPKIFRMSSNAYTTAYLLQSQNSSAKMALIVDELFTMFLSIKNDIKTLNWYKLDNIVVYTFHDAFVFMDNAFYFRMYNKIINDFIPTGIMNHLITNFYIRKFDYEKIIEDPKVLNLADLAFGFNIWLCACLVSVFGFIAEHVTFLIKNRLKTYA